MMRPVSHKRMGVSPTYETNARRGVRSLFPFWIVSICLLTSSVSSAQPYTYYATSILELWTISIDEDGNCSSTLVGPLLYPNGSQFYSSDLAICPDGVLYTTDDGSFFEVNPATAQCILVAFSPVSLGIVGMVCPNPTTIYAVAAGGLGGNLYEVDIPGGTITDLGSTGFSCQGGITEFNGEYYMTADEGLVRLDLSNPGNSEVVASFNMTHLGLSILLGKCNTLLGGGPNGVLTEINVITGEEEVLCSIPAATIGGLTSPDEFIPSPSCEISLDLDGDDSSGATGADYDSEPYSCLTEDGLAVADEDLDLETGGTDIDFMTIDLVGGNANGPDEYLELLAANNITISGSGTDQLTLTNAGGATVADFRNAVLAIRYKNDGDPLIGGDRTIEVQFTLVNGDESNIGVATIPVDIYPDLVVDLGEAITICQGDVTLLEAGIPDAEYLWSTNETTEQIAVANPGQYAVTVTDDLSCPASDTVEVFVLPNIELTLVGDTICQGEEAVISFNTDAGGAVDLIIEATPGGQTLVWTGVNSGYSETVLFDASQTIEITSYGLTSGEDACWPVLELTADVLVNPLDTTFQVVRLCDGESYEAGGGLQTESGTYKDLLINLAGCDSLVITDLAFWPLDTTILQTTSCDPSQVGQDEILFTNENGCDSLVIIITSYSASDTTLIAETTCDPAEEGETTEFFTNQLGCDSVVITTILLLSSDTTLIEQRSCDPTQAGMTTTLLTNQQGCDSLVITTTIFQASDTTVIEQTSCDPAQAGTTTVLLDNQQGCDSLVITSTIFQASDTTLIEQTSCDPAQAGTTTILLTNQQGCDSLVITMVTLLPSSVDTLIVLTCQEQDTGTTVINLTNQAGCDSVIVQIIRWTGADSCKLLVDVSLDQPVCAGELGTIRLSLETGTFPIEVSWGLLNGSSQVTAWMSSDPELVLGGLAPGLYVLVATDANGQTWQDTVAILPGQEFSIDLGPDLQVAMGTTVDLSVQVNPPTTLIESILWEPNLCAFCLDPSLVIDEEITVRVMATTDAGCEDEDQITIRVNEPTRPRVFIPSVFSPNNDGINDLFAPQGDASIRVDELAIYGRWGELIYQTGQFQLGDPDQGWDGRMRDDPAHVDVYVYVALLRWPDGTTRIYKGDVQLLR